MNSVIQVEKLGKRYQMSQAGTRGGYRTLRESLSRAFASPFRAKEKASREDFWALKDVGFEVEPGEVVGIVGRNGAGKSTLLKVLSRITRPTNGRVALHGRVGSLLEVGTGFHPELTGRENIYLNGSILGMSRNEITRRFDEIVAFAEVEKFLELPVKRYSSGMYVRLAFAVAANLEPEILLIDEVLAVGDAAFQKKCLGKMKSIGAGGRTILFVSHNMPAVQNLCTRAILLDGGGVRLEGETSDVIKQYYSSYSKSEESSIDLETHTNRSPGMKPFFRHIEFEADGKLGNKVPMGGSLTIRLRYRLPEKPRNLQVGVIVEDIYGQRVVSFSPTFQCPDLLADASAEGVLECRIPWVNLLEGEYYVSLFAGENSDQSDVIERAGCFQIEQADVYETGRNVKRDLGVIYLPSDWVLS